MTHVDRPGILHSTLEALINSHMSCTVPRYRGRADIQSSSYNIFENA